MLQCSLSSMKCLYLLVHFIVSAILDHAIFASVILVLCEHSDVFVSFLYRLPLCVFSRILYAGIGSWYYSVSRLLSFGSVIFLWSYLNVLSIL